MNENEILIEIKEHLARKKDLAIAYLLGTNSDLVKGYEKGRIDLADSLLDLINDLENLGGEI